MKKIIEGLKNCLDNFRQWRYLISYKNYNDYEHWVFFNYINGTENIEPYIIKLSPENYDALIKMLNTPPDSVVVDNLKEFMNRPSPWDNSETGT
jgi:hypothetical protein